MEVTVDGMDAVVEHTGMCLLRVTGMTVLNQCSHYDISANQGTATCHSPYGYSLEPLVLWIRRAGGISSVIMLPRFFGGENGRIFFTRRPE